MTHRERLYAFDIQADQDQVGRVAAYTVNNTYPGIPAVYGYRHRATVLVTIDGYIVFRKEYESSAPEPIPQRVLDDMVEGCLQEMERQRPIRHLLKYFEYVPKEKRHIFRGKQKDVTYTGMTTLYPYPDGE